MSHPLDEQQWWGYVIIGQDKGKAVSKGRICETLHKTHVLCHFDRYLSHIFVFALLCFSLYLWNTNTPIGCLVSWIQPPTTFILDVG